MMPELWSKEWYALQSQAWVYRIFDAAGELLYVGCTQRGQDRIDQHLKAPWGGEIARSTVEVWPNLNVGRQREKEIIRLEKPRCNRMRYLQRALVPVTFVATPARDPLADALGVAPAELLAPPEPPGG